MPIGTMQGGWESGKRGIVVLELVENGHYQVTGCENAPG